MPSTEWWRLPGKLFVELDMVGGVARYVLRSDAATSLPGSIGRREEYAVIAPACEASVPTPMAHALTKDVIRPNSHAYLLDFLDGEAIGAK